MYSINKFQKNHKLLCCSILFIFNISINGQNVGIGTNNPTEKLTVDGTILVERNSNSNAPHLELHETEFDYTRLKFTNSTTTNYFNVAGRPSGDPAQARFNLFNSDFGNIITATGHGRVGVNTIPAATLHANSEPDTDPLRIQNNNNTKFRILKNNAISIGAKWDEGIANVVRVETPNMFIGFDKNHVPEKRLEVEGDVRITGGIKANEVEGTPGQLLTTGADGNIAWIDPCNYSRFYGFPISGTESWIVPDDVVEIMVELWGAGGGGATGGGGGAGGYAKVIFTVTPGETLTIVTGSGGGGVSNGASQDATDGGSSSISGTNIFAGAIGGKGATIMSAGSGGTFSISPPYLSATARDGGNGFANLEIPIYSGTSKRIRGKGGQSPFSADNYGKGDVEILQGSSPDLYQGSSGSAPGGGGGGGNQFGNNGGDGYIIIHWK